MAIFNPFNITPYSLYKELQRHHAYYDQEDMELEKAIKKFNRAASIEGSWSITPLGNLIGTSEFFNNASHVFTNFFGFNSEWEAHLSKEDLDSIEHTFITTLLRSHPNKEIVKKFYQMTTQDFIEERNSIILDYLRDYSKVSDYELPEWDNKLLLETKIDDRIVINIYNIDDDPITIETFTEDRLKQINESMTKLWGDILKEGAYYYTILSRYGYPQVLLHFMSEDL